MSVHVFQCLWLDIQINIDVCIYVCYVYLHVYLCLYMYSLVGLPERALGQQHPSSNEHTWHPDLGF